MVKGTLTEEIKRRCTKAGIDVIGIADPACMEAPPGLRPGELLSDCRSVIVLGKAIPHDSYAGEKPYTEMAFRYFSLLDSISRDVSVFLTQEGYGSLQIGSNRPIVFRNGKFQGIVSLKHAAQAAGIGTIGRNTLLLSKQFGPRLRLGGVLTTAGLPLDVPLKKSMCIKGCTICIDRCPYKALNGGGIDFFSCLTHAHGHPFMFMTGIVKVFPEWKALNSLGAWSYNTVGKKYSYLCSECIISCPLFRIGLKK